MKRIPNLCLTLDNFGCSWTNQLRENACLLLSSQGTTYFSIEIGPCLLPGLSPVTLSLKA